MSDNDKELTEEEMENVSGAGAGSSAVENKPEGDSGGFSADVHTDQAGTDDKVSRDEERPDGGAVRVTDEGSRMARLANEEIRRTARDEADIPQEFQLRSR